MKFECPNCGQPFDGLAVQEINCSTCHYKFNPRPPREQFSRKALKGNYAVVCRSARRSSERPKVYGNYLVGFRVALTPQS